MSAEEEEEEPTQLQQEELLLQEECIRLQQEQIHLQKEYIRLRDEQISTYEGEFVILRHLSSDLSIQVQQLQDRMEKDSHNSHQTFSGHRLHQPTKGLRKKGKKKP